MWNTDPDTHRSVRSPAFFGPCALAAALVTVSLFSDPIWSQFHWLKADAMNTTMLIGAYGACIKLRNTTGVVGPSMWCSTTNLGYKLNINLEGNTFVNFPTGTTDDNVILGLTPTSGTTLVKNIITAKSNFQILHILASVFALLCVISLIAPAKWFNKGKGTVANIQRSGIITLILGGVAFIASLIAFVGILINVLNGRSALNAIDGIEADWSSGCSMWYVLPCVILYIPAFASVLLPSYVRPAEQDDVESPMHPLGNNNPHGNSTAGFNKMDDIDSAPGTPHYAGSVSSKNDIKWGLQKWDGTHTN